MNAKIWATRASLVQTVRTSSGSWRTLVPSASVTAAWFFLHGPDSPRNSTPPPTARDRECPPAPRQNANVSRQVRCQAPWTRCGNGYTCRARHKGAVPDGNHLLLTKQQQTGGDTGKTHVLFKGDLKYLKLLGAKIAVIKGEDSPNCIEISRVGDDQDVHIVPCPPWKHQRRSK